MTAAGAFKGLSRHQEMVFADNLSLAGSAIEPDANTGFAVRKTDIWEYFHFSRPLQRRLNHLLHNRKTGPKVNILNDFFQMKNTKTDNSWLAGPAGNEKAGFRLDRPARGQPGSVRKLARSLPVDSRFSSSPVGCMMAAASAAAPAPAGCGAGQYKPGEES